MAFLRRRGLARGWLLIVALVLVAPAAFIARRDPTQQPAGPGQVINQIKNSNVASQNPAERLNLAQYITNNSGGGKDLTYGNLLTFPLEGQMFYVQPIYVQAATGSGSFPQNKVTVVLYGTRVAWGDTLEQAITGLFGEGDGGTQEPDEPSTPDEPAEPDTPLEAQLAAAIAAIQAAYDAGQEALQEGDFAAYGEAQDDLAEAIRRANQISAQLAAAATAAFAPFTTGSISRLIGSPIRICAAAQAKQVLRQPMVSRPQADSGQPTVEAKPAISVIPVIERRAASP